MACITLRGSYPWLISCHALRAYGFNESVITIFKTRLNKLISKTANTPDL